PRDQGWNNVSWDFDPDAGEEALYPGEISARKVLREINGYQTADPKQHLKGFAELKDDGSTTCPSWIYCGRYPAWDQNLTAQPKPDGIGLDALSGTQPFIMRADGKGWLFVPAGLVDGPLPTHYEPHESPVQNPLYKQQTSPVHKVWAPGKPYNKLAVVGDPK